MSTYDSNKQAIQVDFDEDMGTYEIPGAAEVEDWGEVMTSADGWGGNWMRRAGELVGWDGWAEVWDVDAGEMGKYVYFVGPVV